MSGTTKTQTCRRRHRRASIANIDPTWVAAIASTASAFVVAVTAVAAFVQIRHVRNANEITVFLKLVERLDTIEADAAFDGITALAERVRNAARDAIASGVRLPELAPIGSLLR